MKRLKHYNLNYRPLKLSGVLIKNNAVLFRKERHTLKLYGKKKAIDLKSM